MTYNVETVVYLSSIALVQHAQDFGFIKSIVINLKMLINIVAWHLSQRNCFVW